MMNFLNIPENHVISAQADRITYDFNLTVFKYGDEVRFAAGDLTTSPMGLDDDFVKRISFENLNPYFREKHISKEIEIKNTLDNAKDLLEKDKPSKAITLLDEVLYYDFQYAAGLFLKSKALFAQGHYVKSLRHYKKAVKADGGVKDVEYHRMLLKKSSEERDSFPKIKRNIYAGDEYFSKGDFTRALVCYDKALANPSNFKTKILSKLLNKKATALIKLKRISEAVSVLKQSVSVKANDYAYFCLGLYSDIGCMKKALKISKRQLILKACKLHEAGESDLALECLDEFFENHYYVDDDYRNALDLKLEVLKTLNMDIDDIPKL